MKSLSFFIIFIVFSLSIGASLHIEEVKNVKRDVKIISIGYHSDTCNDCNTLKAKMKKMNRKFLTSPIIFIKYNKTNKKKQVKSERKLKKWGMLNIAKKEEGLKHVVLYNASTKEAIVTLFHTDSVDQLERKIKEALTNTP